jgi:hypothetical protein
MLSNASTSAFRPISSWFKFTTAVFALGLEPTAFAASAWQSQPYDVLDRPVCWLSDSHGALGFSAA